jgi:hypothetical protein
LAGVITLWPVVLPGDERTMVYSFRHNLSGLFVVEGSPAAPARRKDLQLPISPLFGSVYRYRNKLGPNH